MIQIANSPFMTRLMLVVMLFGASLTFQSCGPSLPSGVMDIVGKLGTDAPKLFNQAKNLLKPEYIKEADRLLGMIGDAQGMLGDSKIPGISDMFGKLGTDNIGKFMDTWKSKGKLSPEEIKSGIDGFNGALGEIKKAGGVKK
ncbi:MAG: hypothetical protein ACOYNO_10580 [Saprospiraceae bacterium]